MFTVIIIDILRSFVSITVLVPPTTPSMVTLQTTQTYPEHEGRDRFFSSQRVVRQGDMRPPDAGPRVNPVTEPRELRGLPTT
jgi:hypothetical protein